MKNVIGLILILAAISISGCKKSKMDCETNNYGTLKINYGLSNYRHSIIVTLTGTTTSRAKITAIGQTSDTLHLTPSTYSINISSIDAGGLAIDSQNGSSTIKQCDESSTSVSF
jgi:hypothetical protein